MLLPIESVLRRGAVFRWIKYTQLDDPKLAGKSKSKYIVMLSASALDDPFFYILTTSEKPKHASHPFPADLLTIPAGSYPFLSLPTLIDVGEAGQLDIEQAAFIALYESGQVAYLGNLSHTDVAGLVGKILSSRRVSGRFKQVLSG